MQAIGDYAGELRQANGEALGQGLITAREAEDRLEAAFADGVHRFDKSGKYAADGALGIVAWLRWKCKLSGSAAAERVTISRQLEKLPETQKAFANGDIGYQHVAGIARTAEQVGAAEVRKSEATLVKTAGTMDPGHFIGFLKSYEHQVDAHRALTEANHGYERRYFHVSEPADGLVRLDGMLDAEGGAILTTALNRLMPPPDKDDDRTGGQRRADAPVDLGRRESDEGNPGPGARPPPVVPPSAQTPPEPHRPPARPIGGGRQCPGCQRGEGS